MKTQTLNTAKQVTLKKLFSFILFSCSFFLCQAQNKSSDIIGNYMVPSKDGAIQIYESNGKKIPCQNNIK